MKKLLLLLSLALLSSSSFAQSQIDNLIEKGISFHDKGQYSDAINTYKQALDIDTNSALAHYELSLTYMEAKEFENALKHSSKVMELKVEKYLLPACIIQGSSLDYLGRTEESIHVFEKGIKDLGDHHLLYYNLGYDYYKLKNYQKAQEAFIHAIETNSAHASSHLLLANLMYEQNKKSQSLLSLYYFLLLEPNTERSSQAYALLMEQLRGNVKKGKDNQINILFSVNEDNEFSGAEMMISMLEASNSLEKNKRKTEAEKFISNTEAFFKILGELNKDANEGIWWDIYIPFFYEIAQSKHMDAYCHYIGQASSKESATWLKKNDKKVEQFATWLQSK